MSQGGPARLATFRDEHRRFHLLCSCEVCVHSITDQGNRAAPAPSCGLGYPNRQHLDESIVSGTFVFCKSFEAT